MKLLMALSLFISLQTFAKDLTIIDPYVRLLPPSSPTTGAFMKIKNNSDKEIHLIKATSDCCNLVEIHTHKMIDGMMRMREVEKISIPSNATTELKPGSFHIMLIGLKKPLSKERKINLQLSFDNGEKLDIEALVMAIDMQMKKMKH